MQNIATLAAGAVEQSGRQAGTRAVSPLVRKLFVVLHGAYGNQFAGKFATGKTNDEGEDLGTRAAMLVWDNALSRFAGDVVDLAARRLVKESPRFPFNLGELEEACEAATPRRTHAELEGVPRLAAPRLEPVKVSIPKVGDGRDWARVILARAAAGDRTVSRGARDHACAALRKVEATSEQ